MSPEDRALLNQVAELAQAILPTIEALSNYAKQSMAATEVYSHVIGLLITELSKMDPDPRTTFDRILAQATAVVEARPDKEGRVLTVVDSIRSAAEASFD